MTRPTNSDGHPWEIPVDRWEESMPIPYSKQNLGESSYTPATHDAVVDRYVKQEPFHNEPYATQPVTDATGYGGTPLRGQVRPDG